MNKIIPVHELKTYRKERYEKVVNELTSIIDQALRTLPDEVYTISIDLNEGFPERAVRHVVSLLTLGGYTYHLDFNSVGPALCRASTLTISWE